ncbi:Wzz/FepE/Etk N-terminal domain-containing protein [Candidatus Pseudothioglobus singularis]|nr:Wzz/FepE/Etk N-terminal domain-containing protein [Candidatus Pseudothioglobus singularis]MDA8854601.1 Wzz/FepE/Etk N-terminal domain-containing protein [Candidatus Pseudothioglobus singularis]
MAQNLTQPSPYEDEIDLREIFKILIESKKLIILTTLIFTMVSIVYSLSQKSEFTSSSLFEIGYYEMLDGSHKVIDKPSELIEDLKLNLITKNPNNEFNQAVSMLPIQNKLIQFETTSISSKTNEKLLNKFFSYIDNHHASFMKSYTDNYRNDLHNKIDLIESEFEKERLNITNDISKKSADIPFLDQKISQLSRIIADNKNILFLLENDPQLFIERATISPNLNVLTNTLINNVTQLVNQKNTLLLDIDNLNSQLEFENNSTQSNELLDLKLKQEALEIELESVNNQKIINSGVIGDIKITTIKPKYLLIISLGIVLGFISSIFLVFIRNFIKSLRESEA